MFPTLYLINLADGDGKQYNMDATVAYKQAALNAIAYLMKVRHRRPCYSRDQLTTMKSWATLASRHVSREGKAARLAYLTLQKVTYFRHFNKDPIFLKAIGNKNYGFLLPNYWFH